MAITLGGVTLPPGMIWSDQFKQNPISQTNKRTLGGTLVVYERSLTAGRPITLEAQVDQGWLTRKQLDQVIVLALAVGQTYTLVIGLETFTVIFLHEDEPAVEFEPLVFRLNSLDTQMSPDGDYFTGLIKLITV